MVIKIIISIAILIGSSYWYYNTNRYTIPETIEITSWAKENIHEQLSAVKKPVTVQDIQKAYEYLIDKETFASARFFRTQ